MVKVYSKAAMADSATLLPDVEVFYADEGQLTESEHGGPNEAGWYWWFCQPGCLPDSEPNGPFKTMLEAVADVKESDDDD